MEALPELRQDFIKVAEVRTSRLVHLVSLYRETVFFECEHPFIDKLMVITGPAVQSARE